MSLPTLSFLRQNQIETLTPLKDQPFEKAEELRVALEKQLALNQELGLSDAQKLEAVAEAA